MSLTRKLHPLFTRSTGTPDLNCIVYEPGADEMYSALEVAVVRTSVQGTIAALKKAGSLARGLGARITLVALRIVPYPLPLTSPPVPLEFDERLLLVIASEGPLETTVRLYLCRDQLETLAKVLKPHSLVVIGGRRRWWSTPEIRLATHLRRVGHEVIFTEPAQ
jgi:hypothetical protein